MDRADKALIGAILTVVTLIVGALAYHAQTRFGLSETLWYLGGFGVSLTSLYYINQREYPHTIPLYVAFGLSIASWATLGVILLAYLTFGAYPLYERLNRLFTHER